MTLGKGPINLDVSLGTSFHIPKIRGCSNFPSRCQPQTLTFPSRGREEIGIFKFKTGSRVDRILHVLLHKCLNWKPTQRIGDWFSRDFTQEKWILLSPTRLEHLVISSQSDPTNASLPFPNSHPTSKCLENPPTSPETVCVYASYL